MITAEEVRHLDEGPRVGEVPGGVGLIEVVASTSGDSGDLLRRCREVVRSVLLASADGWPAEYEWREGLPDWFVEGCAAEETPEEEARWLAWWRGLSGEARTRAARERSWSLTDWLYWLQPDERQWYWWDGVAHGQHEARILVEVPGYPGALGALEWLLRVAGADSVEVVEGRVR